jgi:hypothetical protein
VSRSESSPGIHSGERPPPADFSADIAHLLLRRTAWREHRDLRLKVLTHNVIILLRIKVLCGARMPLFFLLEKKGTGEIEIVCAIGAISHPLTQYSSHIATGAPAERLAAQQLAKLTVLQNRRALQ